MAVIEVLTGNMVRLRCAEASDAQFTLDIRNDPKLTEFIPKVNGSLETQIQWIEKQRKDELDAFMIIENRNGVPKGTLSFYNVNLQEHVCDLGRYISYGNALENVEAVVLALNFLFDRYGIEKVLLGIDNNNKKVISFWKKFGAIFVQEDDMGTWVSEQYILTKDAYQLYREKISSLLKRG